MTVTTIKPGCPAYLGFAMPSLDVKESYNV